MIFSILFRDVVKITLFELFELFEREKNNELIIIDEISTLIS